VKYSELKLIVKKMRHFGYVRTQNGFYKRWFFGGNSHLGIELTTEEVLYNRRYLDLFLMGKDRRVSEARRASYRSREVLT